MAFTTFLLYPIKHQAIAASPQPLGPTGTWNMIFNDEFDGSTLDGTKWSVCYPWDCHTGGNGELMVYTPQNATVNNGQLTITAEKKQTCDGSYCANYGSSLIQTGVPKTGGSAKFAFTYGFVEARMKVPYGTGYFPAFWLLGPQSEIDLMEVFGNRTDFSCGAHLNHYSNHWGCPSFGTNTAGSYHTFGVDWESNKMTFYYDGSPIGSTSDTTKIPSDALYIILNLAIGANFIPPPDNTTVFPAYLSADYIRVWKYTGQSTPTPTTGNSNTLLSLTVCPHGLGKCGDNVNSNATGTTEMLHPQRTVSVQVYNAMNQLATTKQGTVIYNTTAGNFQGNVVLGTLPSGQYTMKIAAPQYLVKTVPGIISVTANQTTQLPITSLIAGDSNNDNKLSILDYNILIDCFSDISPAKNCADPAKKLSADLTDDGKVNQFDYNLLLRELSVQSGQ